MIFPVKIPEFITKLFPAYTWKINTEEKTLYLTFDDGPVNEVTPFVLDLLKEFKGRATFFCIGDNIRKHPEVYERIINEGHKIGNHTFNHLSGWTTDNESYFLNIKKCQDYISSDSNLFRPPYGRIKSSQAKLIAKDFRIIMWDVLTGDYQSGINLEKRLKTCISKTEKGSIIVFHDSFKAFDNLKFLLPRFMRHFADRGFKFESIPL